MAILIFVLSVVLLIAGAASGYQSLDLLPDVMGVLYALAGAVSVAAAVVTFAIGVMILRVDALAKLVRQSGAPCDPGCGPRQRTGAGRGNCPCPGRGRSGDAGERQ